jgi:hypothetical protein
MQANTCPPSSSFYTYCKHVDIIISKNEMHILANVIIVELPRYDFFLVSHLHVELTTSIMAHVEKITLGSNSTNKFLPLTMENP